MSFYTRAPATTVPLTGVENDVEVPNPPSDSVSCMSFSPQADILAVGSWDCKVRMYEVNATRQAQMRAMYEHAAPVLSICWNKAGDYVFSAGVDNVARSYHLPTGQTTVVAQHDGPIKAVRWVDPPYMNTGMLVTGSWDKTIKYWDLRSATPMATIQLPERCYAMDIAFPLMVVGTAELGGERNITIYDLNNPTEKLKVMKSPLNFQTRVITCFPKGSGFCIGSVEGRVALHYIDEKSFSNNYSFRCHRKSDKAAASSPRNQTVVYAINDVNFHPVHGGTFSTCGSDGTINYWDGEARIRLKILDASASGSISSTCFNRTGTIQAYAVSYDWHKGHTGNTPGLANKIMLHMCKEEEVKRQNKT